MIEPRDQLTKDEAIDSALRDLLGPAARPQMHGGFEQRLERAIAIEAPKRRKARIARLLLWSYWIIASLASVAIGWYVRDSFGPGAGLWISVGGGASLLFGVLAFCLLAWAPTFPRAGARLLNR